MNRYCRSIRKIIVGVLKALRYNRRQGRIPVEVDRRWPGALLPWTCKEATALMNNAMRELREALARRER